MPSGFVRGALVAYMPTFGQPVPNVIVFQFNPETITHTWQAAVAARTPPPKQGTSKEAHGTCPEEAPCPSGGNPLAVCGMPAESFSFTLVMNADSDLPGLNADPLAPTLGIYSRLAALEMLLYPTGAGGSSGLMASAAANLSSNPSNAPASGNGASSPQVPQSTVPVVIFVWGANRIVPVRVASLTITEKLYDASLNPTYAEAQINMTVLTPEELYDLAHNQSDPLARLANMAYLYTQAQRQAFAVLNWQSAAQAQIGMIP